MCVRERKRGNGGESERERREGGREKEGGGRGGESDGKGREGEGERPLIWIHLDHVQRNYCAYISTHNALTNQTANLYILSECGGCSLLASVIDVGGVGMYSVHIPVCVCVYMYVEGVCGVCVHMTRKFKIPWPCAMYTLSM